MSQAGDLRLVKAHGCPADQRELDTTVAAGIPTEVGIAGVDTTVVDLIVAAGIVGERGIDVGCRYRAIGACQSARLEWKPQNTIPVDLDTATSLFRLIETLEDNDDVRTVSANFDVSDDVMAQLSA